MFKFITAALLTFMVSVVPVWSQTTNELLGDIREALVDLPNNLTSNRAELAARNEVLQRLLAESYALNLNHELERISSSLSTRAMVGNITDNQEQTNIDEPEITSSPYTVIGSGKVQSVPVNFFGPATYTVQGVTTDVKADTYAIGWSYLLGNYDSGKLKLFDNNNSQLSARLPNEEIVLVNILTPFTYEIKLPPGAQIADGLFEAKTGLILGVLIETYEENNVRFARYQLPFQLRPGDELQVIQLPIVSNIAESTDNE